MPFTFFQSAVNLTWRTRSGLCASRVPCVQGNHPFQGGNGIAVEQGEFAYPKASGPKFEFSDDEDDEDHGDGDDESNEEDHKGKTGKNNGKEEVPEPKVGSCTMHTVCDHKV